MDINDRLYVEICPLEHGQIPTPHPIEDARFDPNRIYKVLGMYNPSETSECYFVLVNADREIWFIPQRHLRAYGLLDGDDFSLPRPIKGSSTRASINGSVGRNGKTAPAIPAAADAPPVNGRPGHPFPRVVEPHPQTPARSSRPASGVKRQKRHRAT